MVFRDFAYILDMSSAFLAFRRWFYSTARIIWVGIERRSGLNVGPHFPSTTRREAPRRNARPSDLYSGWRTPFSKIALIPGKCSKFGVVAKVGKVGKYGKFGPVGKLGKLEKLESWASLESWGSWESWGSLYLSDS